MHRTYIIMFTSDFTDSDLIGLDIRDKIIKYLMDNNHIQTYSYCLPFSFFVISELSSKQLFEIIKNKFNQIERILIARVHESDYWGELPPDQWQMFYNQSD